MKYKRHNKIIEIISEYCIETQDQLIEKLKESGFDVTQATVSRDIRDLKLVKIAGDDTIFVLLRDYETALEFVSKFRKILKSDNS